MTDTEKSPGQQLRPKRKRTRATPLSENILTIDIGGSFIKATVLSRDGVILQEFNRSETPRHATPEAVMEVIRELCAGFHDYDKVSVGFPGYIKRGIVCTAPNLSTDLWKGINLNRLLTDVLNKPVRTINDADLQGLGVVSEQGLEMVITLGTGFGTALLLDGHLLPHLELAHHPVSNDETYDDFVGARALQQHGEEIWNERMQKVINVLKTVFNYDHLYIGGGNSAKLNFKMDNNVSIITNVTGIIGGARLWQLDDALFLKAANAFRNT
jgi:polyphosphate glucokinase